MSIIRNYEALPYNQDTYEQVLSWIQEDVGDNYTYTEVKPYAGVLFDWCVVILTGFLRDDFCC